VGSVFLPYIGWENDNIYNAMCVCVCVYVSMYTYYAKILNFPVECTEISFIPSGPLHYNAIIFTKVRHGHLWRQKLCISLTGACFPKI